MSLAPYIPRKYITTADVFDLMGISEEKQKTISAEERKRYATWVREANTNVETDLFGSSDVMPLTEGTTTYTYAKSDYLADIARAKKVLEQTPSKRTEPIQKALTTDSLEDLIIPYSQTLGYPPDLLY